MEVFEKMISSDLLCIYFNVLLQICNGLTYFLDIPSLQIKTFKNNLFKPALLDHSSSPFGIFCSSLKTGLFWMNGFALKKCIEGRNWGAEISFSFRWWRWASSFFSASSLSVTWPPVSLDSSWWISSSLWAGSGIPSDDLQKSNNKGKKVTLVWWSESSISLRTPADSHCSIPSSPSSRIWPGVLHWERWLCAV